MPRTKGAHGKHNKVKPVKEKKKRGRPHKQHQQQHQQQKQIVNVNVNGGGGGGGGNKTIPVPFQLPSTIYDPSLITPHYGINDRQPVNPLTDAATDLMTPFIQSLISNQAQKVDRIPISGGDVKPINPVIPKPKPQYIPNPQTDQSHPTPQTIPAKGWENIIGNLLPKQKPQPQSQPIKEVVKPVNPVTTNPPPEIDMGVQIPIKNKNIHNKHVYNKNLQNEIQPQMPQKPPEIKKPKIKDNEGLGSNIPIESLEGLALTIGGAALTGGATAAGEAFVGGGLAGVMGAGEAILGASIGSGVATGASAVLGQSAVGNIASGIIGGVAGKSIGVKIGNRLRNRNATQPPEISQPTEQTPLLGNRLGGRRGRNRLVNDRIEIQPDVQSVNRLAPEIERPQPVPGKSTMEILKNIVKKK
jgi:hypothetical protein